MNESIKKPIQISPESYNPKRPEILSMVKDAIKNGQSLNLPFEFVIPPKDKIAAFSGTGWPFSNVEPAVYGALGLFYGRTEKRDDTGALINSDTEYSIHNVLTGFAFGLFYCLPDDSLSMALYGFASHRLHISDYSEDDIKAIIKDQICRGNLIHIDQGNGPIDCLIWGYKNGGNTLLGYQFEHGDDKRNRSYDLENPSAFDFTAMSFSDPSLYQANGDYIGGIVIYQPDGEKIDRDTIYRKALSEGCRMLTQTEPNAAMSFKKVHYGYGQAIYDEWIRQLEKANAENSEKFYFSSPIFPHFIALYENRLHLYKFLKIYAKSKDDKNLRKAAALCEKLKDLAQDGAQVGFENQYSEPKVLAMSANERRSILIFLLIKCRYLEIGVAKQIKAFLENTEARDE